MRRPSWNKSQAIQQVISLKALLEPASDSDAATARKKLHIPPPQILPNRVRATLLFSCLISRIVYVTMLCYIWLISVRSCRYNVCTSFDF